MAPTTVTSDPLPLTCRVARWYFWRVAKFTALFLAAGLWFGYDGIIGYPKANGIAAEYDWFQNEVRATYTEMDEAGQLAGWPALAKSRNWPTGENGEPISWVSYAAGKGWPEKPPKQHSQSSIRTQIYIGLGGVLTALAAAMIGFLNRNKTLCADTDSLVAPNGTRIPFARVREIDRRPWRTKGFARIIFEKESGRKGRAVIDDLKFEGAEKVLERLLAHFDGILIDEISADDDAEDAASGRGSGAVAQPVRQAI